MPRGRLIAVLAASALVLPALVSCGSGDDEAAAAPGKDATDCRELWAQVGKDIEDDLDETNPSALPRRWTTIAAAVDYNRTSASGEDCLDRLDTQQSQISALRAFSTRLAVFDMQAQLEEVRDDAEAYAAGPWPPAPTPTPTPGAKQDKKKNKGKNKKKPPAPPRPPKPELVAAALKSLAAQAPVATQQQGPGWEQASVVDLDDTAATAKAVTDLQFLSTESSAWRACQAALATIRTALAAKTP